LIKQESNRACGKGLPKAMLDAIVYERQIMNSDTTVSENKENSSASNSNKSPR